MKKQKVKLFDQLKKVVVTKKQQKLVKGGDDIGIIDEVIT